MQPKRTCPECGNQMVIGDADDESGKVWHCVGWRDSEMHPEDGCGYANEPLGPDVVAMQEARLRMPGF